MSKVPSRCVRSAARGHAVATPEHAGFGRAAAAHAVAAAFAVQCASAGAQPAGAQVVAGQASLVRNGSNLVVTTYNAPGTRHSAINWQSFSVPAGSSTQFDQPSAGSTSINRVLGPDPSAIFGTLRSNGRLVLVNPAGIAVGAGAVVDTAGFTASTLQMNEADAIAGRLRFRNEGDSAGLTVGGTIRAQGGDIVLVAPNVQTASEALVQSDGATLLAAGRKVEITGRGLEGIHLDVQAGNQAVNLGTLRGDAVGIFAGTLRHSGLVQAQAVSIEGGKVVLQASAGDSLVNGRIEARASAGKGGSIDVLGARVGILAGAALDASGASGGGQVRVGGDFQGRNAAGPNAARTYVDAAATLQADATERGDGGRVIVWSDVVTRMHGQISARGGPQGGNGGFTEVSGKNGLEFGGHVDLRAPRGKAGTLLLDAEDLAIVHDHDHDHGARYETSPTSHVVTEGTDPGVLFRRYRADTRSQLSDLQVSRLLRDANVLVMTTAVDNTGNGGQITVQPDAIVTWYTGSHLTLQADKGIDVLGRIIASHPDSVVHLTARNGSVSIASGATITAGSVALETLSAPPGHVARDVNIEGLVQALGGGVNILAAGALLLDGTISSAAAGNAVVLSANTLQVGAASGIATPSGRWLVYLPDPEGLQLPTAAGRLASGNLALWNRSFAAAPPAAITQAGNRYVFALQPQANITVGSSSKVYDGTIGFRGLDVAVTGLVDAALYGNVFLQDLATGVPAAPGLAKNVGSYALTQGSLDVAGYAVHFTGGALAITPRPLNVAVRAQDKVYDGTTSAIVATTDDRIAGDVLSVGASANFSDKNAGSGKTVNATLTSLAGSDARNYVLAQPTANAQAAITPAALTITANDATKLEGDTLRFNGSEFTASGLVAGERVPSVTLASAGAAASARPDAYAITASAAAAGPAFLPSNYTISYRDGALLVTPAGIPPPVVPPVVPPVLPPAPPPPAPPPPVLPPVPPPPVVPAPVVPAPVVPPVAPPSVAPPPALPASNEVNNQVVSFAQLFLREATLQEDEKKGVGKDAIVITDGACTRR